MHRKSISSVKSLATISNVLLSASIVSSLYFGRKLLIPLALSALLMFMLAPFVTRLQRWFGRIGAILLVVRMMFVAVRGRGVGADPAGSRSGKQTPKLYGKHSDQTPLSQATESGSPGETFDDYRRTEDGPAGRSTELTVSRFREHPGRSIQGDTCGDRQRQGSDNRIRAGVSGLAPVLGPLGTAALVLLLLVFMLLQREDLRNRIIRLIGLGRITSTARAMDDAGTRVSKYLMMQIVFNVTYGIAVTIGLYFIGVPNSILWGALATVLRFIPYVGPWLAAAFPILLSLASSPGWMALLLTVGLFIVFELSSNNVIEPWLYGSSTGVGPIALIVAALVWT